MLKSMSWVGVSLAVAGLCALPALADDPNAGAPPPKERPMRPAFSDIDTNHDGVISQAEYDAFKPKRPEGDRDGPPPRGGGRWGGPPDGGHGGKGMRFHGPDLKALDTNKDGKVSLEEFSVPLKAHFDKLDTNHDGFLDESELKAPPKGDDPEGPPPLEKPEK